MPLNYYIVAVAKDAAGQSKSVAKIAEQKSPIEIFDLQSKKQLSFGLNIPYAALYNSSDAAAKIRTVLLLFLEAGFRLFDLRKGLYISTDNLGELLAEIFRNRNNLPADLPQVDDEIGKPPLNRISHKTGFRDKTEAGKALLKSIKEFVRPQLLVHGFKLFSKDTFIRICDEYIIHYIDFQINRSANSFTCNTGYLLLSVPNDSMYPYNPIRLGYYFAGRDYWLSHNSHEELELSIRKTCSVLSDRVVPLMNQVTDTKPLLCQCQTDKNLMMGLNKSDPRYNEIIGYLLLHNGERDAGNQLLGTNFNTGEILPQLRKNAEQNCSAWKLDAAKFR